MNGKSITDLVKDQNAVQRRQNLTKLFSLLAGAETSVEVFALTLGRERLWQEKQILVLNDLKMLFSRLDLPKYVGMDYTGLGKLLIGASCPMFLLRILRIQLSERATNPESSGGADFLAEWPLVYPQATVLLNHLGLVASKDTSAMESLMKLEVIETVSTFVEGSRDLLAGFLACGTLLTFCRGSQEACERLCCAGALAPLGRLMHRDSAQQLVAKQCQAKVSPSHLRFLLDAELQHCVGLVDKQEAGYKQMVKYSQTAQLQAASLVAEIAQVNDRLRNRIMKDKDLLKSIVKWLQSPAVQPNDVLLIERCAKVVQHLCISEEIAWVLVSKHKLVRYLAYGVLFPVRSLVKVFLDVAIVVANHSGRCREAVAGSGDLLQTVICLVFSYSSQVQMAALLLLTHLTTSASTCSSVFTAGISPNHLHLLRTFYKSQTVRDHVALIRRTLNKFCSRQWKNLERQFSPSDLLYDCKKAEALKSRGNDSFHHGNYIEAAMRYDDALAVAAPFSFPSHPMYPVKNSLFDMADLKEWYLPVVLLSNRAQCHLKTGNLMNAISDCTEALGRCLDDGTEPERLRSKTAYRRARAYLAINEYQLALNDIAYCYRTNPTDDTISTVYRETLLKYREHIGPEPVRLCGLCGKGEGEKLKRCANCTEVYCSRECQIKDWDAQHKQICSGQQRKK